MNETAKLTGRIYGSDAWKSWSPDALSTDPLPGEYFVEFYDAQNNLIGVVRDLLGLMPAYYTLDGGIKIHRTLKLAAESIRTRTLNWNYIYSIMAGNFTLLNESPFHEIFRIPPGHLLFNENGRWVTRSYFRPLRARTVHNFGEAFLSVIEERARIYPNFLISFSGGLDSSLLLAGLLTQNLKPNAATLIFDDPLASEEPALKAFAARWGNCFERIPAPPVASGVYNWRVREWYLYNPTETLFIPIFEHATKTGAIDIWTGYGADEVFTLNSCLSKALLLSGDRQNFFEAVRQEAAASGSWLRTGLALIKELAPPGLRQALASLRSNAQTIPQVEEFKRKARIDRIKRMLPDPIQNEMSERLFTSGYIPFAIEQSHELAYERGLHFSYPYLDLRLIEMALSFNANDFYHFGLNKYALRRHFENILPQEITGRSSRQAYDDWILNVWKHQAESLECLVESAMHKFSLKNQTRDVYDKLKLVYASQFSPMENSNENEKGL